MSDFDPHELRVIRNGLNPKKVIAAYNHFGSLRKTGKACGISKTAVSHVLERYGIHPQRKAKLPGKVSLAPNKKYTDFARWHAEHLNDENLPTGITAIAKLAGVSQDTVKCYLYRRRKLASKALASLPDLRTIAIQLEDIEGSIIDTTKLVSYHYVIDRFAAKAALCGKLLESSTGEITVIIPSIEQFCNRIKHLI